MTKISKKLYFYQIPKVKFQKDYIKKNPKVLFVYDVESNMRVTQFKKEMNVYAVDFGNVKHDGFINENKKIIKNELKKVFSFAIAKKFEKIAIPIEKIGNSLLDESPKSSAYLKTLLRKLERDFRGDSKTQKNNSNIKGKKTVSGKKYTKKEKKQSKKGKKEVEKQLKKTEKYCDACKKAQNLLTQPVLTTRSKESDKFIENIKEGLKQCKKCSKVCDKIKKESKKVIDNIDIIKVRYPVVCRKDYTQKSKISRIYKRLRNKLKEQYETLNKE